MATSFVKRLAVMVLGAILVVLAVVMWAYATNAMTSLVEHFWCKLAGPEVCRTRGYQHFIIWMVLGIFNLVVLGFLNDRARARPHG
ncbi:hypothetical protein RLW55_14040 [Hyphomicrobium sp. B1]|uniref:hypothetical protein n=1 Tax=Hyphomicrobium sp. B1 TaxID=3075651 RepID=UPI003C2FFE78